MTNPDGSGVPQEGMPIGGGGLIGALVGVGAGLYDSYQDRKTAKENTERTIDAQKREAELAYQRQVQMWNMQNAYNSPQAQMQRFIAAGLNPHLIYGQGNAGNASSMPQYQAPNVQYRYAAGNYGQAVASLLPMLMTVGTWMQNMRKSEVDIKSTQTSTDKAQQMIDYLEGANPKLFQQLSNKVFLQNYQTDAAILNNAKSAQAIADMRQKYRAQYGEELFKELPKSDLYSTGYKAQGGIQRLKYLQEESATKLAGAKASMTDLNITDPQALMQLVLSGVMGLAGQQIRLSNKPGQSFNQKSRRTGELPVNRKTLRLHPARRVQGGQ